MSNHSHWQSFAAVPPTQDSSNVRVDDTIPDFCWTGHFPANLLYQPYALGHALGIHHPVPHHPNILASAAARMMAATDDHQSNSSFDEVWGPDGDTDLSQTGAWGPTHPDHNTLPRSQAGASGTSASTNLPQPHATMPSASNTLPRFQAGAPGTLARTNLPQPHATMSLASNTVPRHFQAGATGTSASTNLPQPHATIHLQPHIPDNPQSPLLAVRLHRTQSSGTTQSRTSRRTQRTGIERGEAARQLTFQMLTMTPPAVSQGPEINVVAFNEAAVVSQAKDNMKRLLLGSSLFPAKGDIAAKAKSAWATTVENQPTEYQDLARGSAVSGEKKLVNLVKTMRNDLRDAGHHYTYLEYNLKGTLFLDTVFEANSVLVVVPFGNAPVLEFIAYVMYDSKFQYKQFLGGKDVSLTADNLRPLFLMTGTIFRWALGERSKGIFIASDFVVDDWQIYHEGLGKCFDAISPAQRAALETLIVKYVVCLY
ncbi:hypothetical protein EDD22DRAFT_959447 [Suillus occidentalis]|nr:hypothetical protein EDD22DRAFT_959447 [Suillus occidentalis]